MLTEAAVQKLKAHKQRREVHDGKGLYLVVQTSGAKSWATRFRKPDGARAKLTLGPLDESGKEMSGDLVVGQPLTLVSARALAGEINRQRAMGKDVIAERKSARATLVAKDARRVKFQLAAQDYVEAWCRDKKGRRTWWKIAAALGLDYRRGKQEVPQVIKNSLVDRWKDRAVAEIAEPDVEAAVDEAAVAGIPGRGRRTRARSNAREREMINALSGFFKWAKTKRKLIASLPTAGLEREPSGRRDRVLSPDELRAIWNALPESPLGSVVKLMALTAQRVGEVSGMRWDELGEDAWTIPAERSKNKRSHTVPLSKAARELIKTGSDSKLVFTTNGRMPVSGFSKMKTRLDKKLKFKEHWRLHDLRRTAATMMGEIGIEPHIVEEVLGHVIQGGRGGPLQQGRVREAQARGAGEARGSRDQDRLRASCGQHPSI